MRFPRLAVVCAAAAALCFSGHLKAQAVYGSINGTVTDSTGAVVPNATITVTDVSKWTRKQWGAAKAKWVEEKDAWNGCQTQARTQNLSGRRSWQFLYDCMTKS